MKTEIKLQPWFKSAVFYEISLKSFYDGNNDGIGDFKGLTMKLDYLKDLGITCIWLMPFYPSPLRDDGYDISDYYGIDPIFGTFEDFDNFIEQAHNRGIRIIADLVLNHTSDQHPWFQESKRSRDSPKRHWYVWNENDDLFSDTRVIFNDTENKNWTYDQNTGQYYWHRFYSHQPDLNFELEEVRNEMIKVIDFWLDKGLDGFRMDAVPYLFEQVATTNEGLPQTHEYLKSIRKHVEERYGKYEKVLLAEANQEAHETIPYFGNGSDELHMAFHFPLMPRLFYALAKADVQEIINIINFTNMIPPENHWCLFLRNHDELTLEKVTKEVRQFMWEYYAPNPRMRLNFGIRRRLAPLVDNNRKKIELLNNLIFSLPGSPIIYYGDEIGMGDNIELPDRFGVRTPMQWSADLNGGFSQCHENKLHLPLIADPNYGFQTLNVQSQLQNKTSLINFTKKMINIWKQHSILAKGKVVFLFTGTKTVLAFLRFIGKEKILCVTNFADEVQFCQIDASVFSPDSIGRSLFNESETWEIVDDKIYFELIPYQYHWIKFEEP